MTDTKPTTFSTFAQAFADEERGGRFKAVNQTTIVGTDAIPKYPELPSDSPSHHDPVPDEPPLGFSVEDHEPLGTAKEIEESLKRLGATGDFPSGPPEGGADVDPAPVFPASSDAAEPAAPPTPSKEKLED